MFGKFWSKLKYCNMPCDKWGFKCSVTPQKNTSLSRVIHACIDQVIGIFILEYIFTATLYVWYYAGVDLSL